MEGIRPSTYPARPAAALAATALAAACALLAAPALASPTQESIMMDDAELVFGTAEGVDRRMAELRSLGVDRVRVSVFWNLVAGAPGSRERPSFGKAGPAHPEGYPVAGWQRYDRIVLLARRHGLKLLFNVTSPAPLWATGTPDDGSRAEAFEPSPDDFRDFVTALGTRYSGQYVERRKRDAEDPPALQVGSFGTASSEEARHAAAEEPLPRVAVWSIWNEPNFPAWLAPQRRPDPRGRHRFPLARSAELYRGLANAAWEGLRASGHESSMVLLGETAPRGRRTRTFAVRPLEFVRELYCLDGDHRKRRGVDAAIRGCPRTPQERAHFVDDNPALFELSGWAHHPYNFGSPPDASDPQPDNAPLADLGRLTRTLDRAVGSYRVRRRLPVYLTEFGYQTNPPNPVSGVSWAEQAEWLNRAEHIAYRNRRVASMAQFLLIDTGPRTEFPPRHRRYWGSFQTGLKLADGRPKSAYRAYRLPIDVSPERRGRGVRVFGQLRAAPRGRRLTVRVQLRRHASRGWETLAKRTTRSRRGFVRATVVPPASGRLRLSWVGPHARRHRLRSRSVKVVVERAAKRAPARERRAKPD